MICELLRETLVKGGVFHVFGFYGVKYQCENLS